MLNLDVLYFLVGLTTAYIDDDGLDQIVLDAEAIAAEHASPSAHIDISESDPEQTPKLETA